MIQISEAAQAHFRKLIEREAIPGLGVRLAARDPGTPRADVRLEFAEGNELTGDEWAVDCEGFTLWLDAASVPFLDGASIDYETMATGGQLQIRAPKIKGVAPGDSASLVERVRWTIEQDVNPQLAQHRGNVNQVGASLGVSYTTARTRMDEIAAALGAPFVARVDPREVLRQLEAGEISAEEALERLHG